MENIQVEIFGQRYSLKGGADADYIRELAAVVDARMREVQKGTGTADGYRIAILAALKLADELARSKTDHEALRKTADITLSRLLELTGDGSSV